MRKWFIGAALLVGGIMLVGCTGVTPSLKVGVLHRSSDSTSDLLTSTTGAFKIEALGYGGSIEVKFPEDGVVIVPCGLLVHTTIGSTTEQKTEDGYTYNALKSLYMNEIPGQVCVEVNTAELDSN